MKEKLKFALKGVLALALATLLFVGYKNGTAAVPAKPDILDVLSIEEVITTGTAERVKNAVTAINDNSKIKAVLIVLDTPGGGAIASSHVYEELSRIKVPVVVWCNTLCASGGVYLAMAPSVKYIAVRDETLGGSVGVISTATRFNRLLDWAKIDNETYKSGSLKDAGNSTRAAEKGEREYLQGIVDELADRFYAKVKKARPNISAANWVKIKEARIFFGQKIVDVGLADAVLSRDEAKAKAKELSGSKLIFTRDEIQKMSADATGGPHYSAPQPAPVNQYGDLPWVIELLKEIKSGTSVKFEYRLPYQF